MSTNEGYMIVNGKKVEGRSLSFDSEGLKVGNSGDEKVAVPNGGFNFALFSAFFEEASKTIDFAHKSTGVNSIFWSSISFETQCKSTRDLILP